jgi:hypothetical protein
MKSAASTRYIVKPGRGLTTPYSWVVIDRERDCGVVAEFERRFDAQAYVKEANHA